MFRSACGALIAVLVLGGCSSGGDDASLRAVRDTRSVTVGARMAVGLLLEGRSTPQVTQVVLEDAVDATSAAGSELAGATDVPPGRVATARDALDRALGVLDAISDRGAAGIGPSDLQELDAAVSALDGAAGELSR